MRKLILAAGVAAFAIAVPAAAKPGGGHGGGGGNGGEQQARGGGGGHGGGGQEAHSGGGGQKAQRGGHGGGRDFAVQQQRGGGHAQAQRMERRGGGNQARFANFQSERGHGGQKTQRAERGGGNQRFVQNERGHGGNKAQRVDDRGHQGQRSVQNERGHGNAKRELRADNRSTQRFDVQNRGGDRRMAVDNGTFRDLDHARRVNVDNNVRIAAFDDDRFLRNRDDYRRYDQWRDWDDNDWDRYYGYRGLPASYVGCPPGLAKKSPACVPPGLARSQFVGQVLPTYYSSNYIPRDLRYIYTDTPDYYYRYGDGYVYRVNRANNLVAALLPLIGAGYGVGQYFPYYNQPSYYVPDYYQSFYPDTPYDYYRYDDGYVYRVDAGTGYVEDVIPLLDNGYGVGQMLPVGYSYYNVPYQYRDMYYDTPDYMYRYAPGAIYQVDRDTQLITSVASLLTGGLSVGQPLPPAYSVYNVPMAYRDNYYDRPDAWYRYNNGYIYQVDPTTQLITAIVRAIV
jgi:hypothetical protein